MSISNFVLVGLFEYSLFVQFFSASFVYYVTSTLFPAKETFIDAPILDDNERPTIEDSERDVEEVNVETASEKGSTEK